MEKAERPRRSHDVVIEAPLYTALRERGFDPEAEHVLIHGTPVQFLPSPNDLSDEALATSVTRDLEGVAFRVIDPEVRRRFRRPRRSGEHHACAGDQRKEDSAASAMRMSVLAQTPLGRLGTVDDIAAAVMYLASPAGDWITGQVLSPSGGYDI